MQLSRTYLLVLVAFYIFNRIFYIQDHVIYEYSFIPFLFEYLLIVFIA